MRKCSLLSQWNVVMLYLLKRFKKSSRNTTKIWFPFSFRFYIPILVDVCIYQSLFFFFWSNFLFILLPYILQSVNVLTWGDTDDLLCSHVVLGLYIFSFLIPKERRVRGTYIFKDVHFSIIYIIKYGSKLNFQY